MSDVKKDCRFYEDEKGTCKALNKLYCEEEEKQCNFYKKKEDKKSD